MRFGPKPARDSRPRALSEFVLATLLITFAPLSADPPAPVVWKFDTLRLKNGSVLRGLILEETPTHIRFQNVRRQPGRATVLFTALFTRAEIDRWEKLSD